MDELTHPKTDSVQGNTEEDREARWFPICMGFRYQVYGPKGIPGESGAGQTIDISSTGVLVRTARGLPLGKGVELSIEWPVLLGGRCPLSLVAVGAVVRVEASWAAIRIHRYEFRTRQQRDAVGILHEAKQA